MKGLLLAPAVLWWPHPDWSAYEVSNVGQVRRDDHVLKLRQEAPQAGGRLYVQLSDGPEQRKKRKVHQLVLETFVSPRPEGMVGCHLDNDYLNNVVGNLKWDTQSANMAQSVIDGRHHNANKQRCPQRHLLRLPNLVACRWEQGHRICLACARGRAAVQHSAKSGIWLDVEEVAEAKYQLIMNGEGER